MCLALFWLYFCLCFGLDLTALGFELFVSGLLPGWFGWFVVLCCFVAILSCGLVCCLLVLVLVGVLRRWYCWLVIGCGYLVGWFCACRFVLV